MTSGQRTTKHISNGRAKTADRQAEFPDDRLLYRVASQFGDKAAFRDLWNADPAALARHFPHGGDKPFDHSAADAALCAHLAFWTGKHGERIERIFRSSKLFREKWEKRRDYRISTIQRACDATQNIYRGTHSDATELAKLTVRMINGADHSVDLGSEIIANALPIGTTLLSADPKTGKSWLALNVAQAVTTCHRFLNHSDFEVVSQGDVLFLALEDNQNGMAKRMDRMKMPQAARKRITFVYTPPSIEGSLQVVIREWAQVAKNPRVIIVDMLDHVRSDPLRNETPNRHDMRDMDTLNRLGDEYGVAVLAIHHTRKASSEGVARASGTMKLTGTARAVWFLEKRATGLHIDMTGRSIPGFESAIEHSNFQFRVKTEAEKLSDQEALVLDAAVWLDAANDVISNRNLWSQVEFDCSQGTIRTVCSRLKRKGVLLNADHRGSFRLNDNSVQVIERRKQLGHTATHNFDLPKPAFAT